jgi:hypothetical protein
MERRRKMRTTTAKAIELYLAGKTYKEMSAETGLTIKQLRNHLGQAGVIKRYPPRLPKTTSRSPEAAFLVIMIHKAHATAVANGMRVSLKEVSDGLLKNPASVGWKELTKLWKEWQDERQDSSRAKAR